MTQSDADIICNFLDVKKNKKISIKHLMEIMNNHEDLIYFSREASVSTAIVLAAIHEEVETYVKRFQVQLQKQIIKENKESIDQKEKKDVKPLRKQFQDSKHFEAKMIKLVGKCTNEQKCKGFQQFLYYLHLNNNSNPSEEKIAEIVSTIYVQLCPDFDTIQNSRYFTELQ